MKDNSTDYAIRVAVSEKVLEAYAAFAIGGENEYPAAISQFKEALQLSESLIVPSDSDLFQRREINRYLGMLTYLLEGDDYLHKAEAYYNAGMPLEAANDLRTALFYVYCMNKLADATNDQSYYRKRYDVSWAVFSTRFAEVQDDCYKASFLACIITEKILGRICSQDLDGATEINRILGTLEDCEDTYNMYQQMIDTERRESEKSPGVLGKLFRRFSR